MEILHSYLCFIFIGSLVRVSHAIVNITIAAKLNRDITLPCQLPMESSSGVNVRWFNEKDGWLTSGSKVYKHQGQISIYKPAPNEWNLRIRRVTMTFEDRYTCRTEHGVFISYVRLVIETSPKIDEQASSPTRVTFPETSTATLNCEVSGTPEPEIKWYRGQQSMQEIGVTGPVLKIPAITRYAADEYMCNATNKNGEAVRRMSVTVNFAPEVTVMEPEVYAAGGEVVVMSCVVQASPLHDAFWTLGTDVNGKRINPTWKYLVMVEEGGDDIPVKFLTLIIRKSILTFQDYGKYTCVAKGEDSVAKDTVELKETKAVKADEEGGNVINYN